MNSQVSAALSKAAAFERDIESLYQDWWAGCPNVLTQGDTASDLKARHEPEEWQLLERTDDGQVLVSNGDATGVVPAGEWLTDRPKSVSIQRRASWIDGPWEWRASKRLQPLTARRWRIRLYIPGGEGSAGLGVVGDLLDDAGLWFQAKTWRGAGLRQDQTVLWMAVRDAPSALDLLCPKLYSSSLSPPPLALTVRNTCIGISHDPVDGGSFGMRICGAIVSAGDSADDGPMGRWAEACRFYEIQPQHPWRHPSKVDPYHFWAQAEKMSCR